MTHVLLLVCLPPHTIRRGLLPAELRERLAGHRSPAQVRVAEPVGPLLAGPGRRTAYQPTAGDPPPGVLTTDAEMQRLAATVGGCATQHRHDDTCLPYAVDRWSPPSLAGWRVGGVWSRFFLATTAPAARTLINPAPSRRLPGRWRCDGGPRGLLDLATMRAAARRAAARTWLQWQPAIAGTPPPQRWRDILAEHNAHPDSYPLQQAWRDFTAQPRVAALTAHPSMRTRLRATTWQGYVDLIEQGNADRAEHIENQGAHAVLGYGLLTLAGAWLSEGVAGQYGVCLDLSCYAEQANTYLDTLDPNIEVVAVDCQIAPLARPDTPERVASHHAARLGHVTTAR